MTPSRIIRLYSFVILLGLGLAEFAESQVSAPANSGGVIWANQGWSDAEREFYHFTSQGVVTSRIDWFMSLEQADNRQLLSDPAYLVCFGFMLAPKSRLNPLGLPIGFALAPEDSLAKGTIGLTCAACHSGQLSYRGTRFRIDGSQAMVNTTAFGNAIVESVLTTYYSTQKWNRFARRVLGKSFNPTTEKTLRAQFGATVSKIEWVNKVTYENDIYPVVEGYGRTDAIGRIGNMVFGTDLHESSNFKVANAPVSFPPLWDIWKFDWVQYDASVVQPMSRNTGEDLGVGAIANYLDSNGTTNPAPQKWASSINFENLKKIETQLQSLRAPVWPAQLFGKVNIPLARQGRSLFEQNCASCHAPRPVLPPGDKFAKLAVTTVDSKVIGTDPQRVINSTTARYNPSKLLGFQSPNIDLAEGLFAVTEGGKNWFYDLMQFTPEERGYYNGFDRPNIFSFQMQYKARPLDGIWATPPFLHNGSVRNIYELLSPVSQRAQKFWVGLDDFDPVRLGLGAKSNNMGFMMDTSITGNSNSGHEFNSTSGAGVIGRLLSHNERMAIIEYLKALPEMPPDDLPGVKLDWLNR